MTGDKIQRQQKLLNKLTAEGEASQTLRDWQDAVRSLQSIAGSPDSPRKAEQLSEAHSEVMRLSNRFVILTSQKQSIRNAVVDRGVGTGDVSIQSPISLVMGDGVDPEEYLRQKPGIHLPLHIVVEPNTSPEEIKTFMQENRARIKKLLYTENVTPRDSLVIERDNFIIQFASDGMSIEDIAVEIDSLPKFRKLHGVDGISLDVVSKVIQRKAQRDRQNSQQII